MNTKPRTPPVSEQEAILAILDEHGVRLYTMLLRLTLRYDVADDLMQDLSQDPRCLSARDPAAYVIRTALNLALDYRRGQRRTAHDGGLADAVAATSELPLDQIIRREEMDGVLDAISRLSPLNREVVVLRYVERQDYPTIARHLNRTSHQVRAICHKAIRALRMDLGRQQERPATREQVKEHE